jgi:PAS domain S-box-containing protein
MAGGTDDTAASTPERNHYLQTLVENERRTRTLVESLPDAIIVHRDDKIVFVNPFCAKLLGATSPEPFLGKSIFEHIHPDYAQAVRSRILECQTTEGATSALECVWITLDGASVDVEAVAIPILWNGAAAIEVVARDIRKRKQAERAAQDWQKRLELAHRAGLRIGLWDWQVTSNMVTWSDETYRQFGFTRDTFSGRVEDAAVRIHPDDQAAVKEAIQKVMDGSREYEARYRVVRTDGTTSWIEAHGLILEDGPAPHMLGIGIDITNRKKAELSRQESEENYRLLLNSTAEGIYGLDLQGNCTFCNPACLRLLGYQFPENLLGKNMQALVHHTRADGTPCPTPEWEIYTAVREGEASHIAEGLLWRADGTSFVATYWSYPMHKGGELVGAVVSFLDISDRRQAEQSLRDSEEKYRELFENATHGIFRSDPEGNFLDVNPALVAMLGYGSKAELMACNLNADVYENPAARGLLLGRMGPNERVGTTEINWKRKDGALIVVRISGGQIRNRSGHVTHYDVIVEDITERRNLEAQFRQAQKMEAVGLLAGGISHDFNNHLSVILGNADLLLEKTKSPDLQRYVEEIRKATQRAAQLTRQLLAFSRKQVLYPTLLDLNAVVGDVAKILRHLIGEDVQIVIEGENHLASVRADRGQIEQILMNLATNARDAMPGGGKFTLRTENVDLGKDEVALHPYVIPGRYVHLSATDTGAGMSKEVRSHLFEPFFTTKVQGKGTGLGLATVYGIVKQSGGYVWISGAAGQGATFDIYLPRVDEAAPPLVDPLDKQAEDPKGTETILLLEDDGAVRAVTCEVLAAAGYNVLQAGRGEQAIQLARNHNGLIQLMVCDIVLPDMSGPAVVDIVKKLQPCMNALYVSGYTEVPVAQKLIREGAVLLQKPVSRSTLMRSVDTLLHFRARSASTQR